MNGTNELSTNTNLAWLRRETSRRRALKSLGLGPAALALGVAKFQVAEAGNPDSVLPRLVKILF
jgi:hypothetical protein